MAEAHEVATGQNLDLIISDFYLPDGTGVDFMRWLSERCPVRGIAISGDSDPAIREMCLRCGFAIFLPKPILAATLYQAIDGLFAADATFQERTR